jgi:flagellar hook assembly protein FlgD
MLPNNLSIKEIYPNPFNPETIISYSLPKSQKVSLKIFDITGKEIITLVKGKMDAGNHQIIWNAHNQIGEPISSGIYISVLENGQNAISKSMVYIK